jgi:hypothetical protein
MVSGQSVGQRSLERGRPAWWTRGWKVIEMAGARISKLEPGDPGCSWAVERLRPDCDQGDELRHYDETALPGVHAKAMGIAIVRQGGPIRTTITAIP